VPFPIASPIGESRYAYRHGIRRSRLVQLRDGTELKRGAELGGKAGGWGQRWHQFAKSMENGPFLDGLPIKNGWIFHGELLNNQMVLFLTNVSILRDT